MFDGVRGRAPFQLGEVRTCALNLGRGVLGSRRGLEDAGCRRGEGRSRREGGERGGLWGASGWVRGGGGVGGKEGEGVFVSGCGLGEGGADGGEVGARPRR